MEHDAVLSWKCAACGGRYEFTASAMLLLISVVSVLLYSPSLDSMELAATLWAFQVVGLVMAGIRWHRHKEARHAREMRREKRERIEKEKADSSPRSHSKSSTFITSIFQLMFTLVAVFIAFVIGVLTMRLSVIALGITFALLAVSCVTKPQKRRDAYVCLLLWIILMFSPIEIGGLGAAQQGRSAGFYFMEIRYGLYHYNGSTYSEFRDFSPRGCVGALLPQSLSLVFRMPYHPEPGTAAQAP